MTKAIRILFFTVIGIFGCLSSQGIQSSLHNLSVSGTGSVKASSESEICIFCHTPHNSSTRTPLWNKNDPALTYTLYSSTTQQSTSQTPDGGSLLCLSCHDGTIALGDVLSRTEIIAFTGGITVMPSGRTDLTKFLADDHPISILYDAALASADPELADPSTLTGPVQLKDSKVQCTSCHDPHDDLIGNFLVESNQYSQLCEHCHQKSGWTTASHRNSTSTWNNSGNDPWFHTPYTTVSENACENCHNPHLAAGEERILNYLKEEENCYNCHNGNVAATNIQSDILTDINEGHLHAVQNYDQVHSPNEDLTTLTKHVECVDCHNPHMANGTGTPTAPDVKGPLIGVSGINSAGNPVSTAQYEYEICYKCHADNPAVGSFIPRQHIQNNVRLEFELGNPSFHPVEGPGQNPNVPSLSTDYTESSIIYCTDCHSGDITRSSNGPHGSEYAPILKYQYITADNTPESESAYELCYACHLRSQILDTSTEFGQEIHYKHIVTANTPCSACHDAHGISNTQGTSTNNSHLINFDSDIVSASAGMNPRLEFIDNGDFAGSCYLQCHMRNHNPRSYAN